MNSPVMSFESLFAERAHCPLCGSSSNGAIKRFSVRQINWRIDVLQCNRCKLVYKQHFPTSYLMQLIYSGGYAHFSAATPSVEATAAPTLSSRLSRLGKPGGRLLDYGCGGGRFAVEARAAGWDALGCDPFLPERLRNASDNPMFSSHDAKSTSILALGKFDVISMWAVVEHLEEPASVFENLSKMLNKGGRLVFNSPNGDSLIAKWQGQYWSMAVLVEHLQFHTPANVDFLSSGLGLTVDRMRICGSPYPFGKTSIMDQGVPPSLLGNADSSVEEGRSAPSGSRRRLQSLIKAVVRTSINTDDRDSVVTSLLRIAIDITRTGDHLEVVLRKH